MNAIDLKIKAGLIAEGINTHDISAYVLANPDKLETPLLLEVACHLEFNRKLPEISKEWFKLKARLIAPPKLSLEQSSSKFTAEFKASLFKGNRGADLTGGLGVDSFYFSKSFEHFIYIEKNEELYKLVKYNFNCLKVNNTRFVNSTAEAFLDTFKEKIDFVYIDPARRDSNNKKLVSITDCEPNLKNIKGQIFQICDLIVVKYSPMLDIKLALKELENVSKVYIIAIKNEVKELVFVIQSSENASPSIICVNQNTDLSVSEYSFEYVNEEAAQAPFSLPLKYLYEPNATILKAGAFKSICNSYNLFKLSPNSHLYTSNAIVKGFPGRCFNVQNNSKYNKKEVLKYLKGNKANVACRNFPLKPDAIKKQLNIKDGGEDYLFFTENIKKDKIVLFCTKL